MTAYYVIETTDDGREIVRGAHSTETGAARHARELTETGAATRIERRENVTHDDMISAVWR